MKTAELKIKTFLSLFQTYMHCWEQIRYGEKHHMIYNLFQNSEHDWFLFVFQNKQ